jgi:polysaccharide export outer membrane protein
MMDIQYEKSYDFPDWDTTIKTVHFKFSKPDVPFLNHSVQKGNDMKRTFRFRNLLCVTGLLTVCACVVTGEVVKVTEAKKGAYAGLKEEDKAKLNEMRKSKADEGLADNLKSVITETEHYTVEDYLRVYPDSRGPGAGDYHVGGYDVLHITVYEEEDLSKEAVRVSGDGYISFPLIGRVQVAGLTTSEIEKEISERLAEQQYLLDAHVSVMVTEYNSQKFIVLGAVNKPGSYPLQANERILDAISKSGGIRRPVESHGYSERAGNKAMIIRMINQGRPNEKKVVINVNLRDLLKGKNQFSNLVMSDKDVLYIPTADSFYIIGQVKQPGSYTLPDKDITLVEAISIAGGFTPIASRNRTRIIRVEEGVEKIIEVQVDAITDAGKKIDDVIIRPDDVIIVPESFF